MNTDKLKKLFDASTDKYGDAKKMGTTYQTLTNVIGGADMKVSTLEKVAKFYGVPIGYFFDETEADGRKTEELEIERLKGQIEGLKDALSLIGENYKQIKRG